MQFHRPKDFTMQRTSKSDMFSMVLAILVSLLIDTVLRVHKSAKTTKEQTKENLAEYLSNKTPNTDWEVTHRRRKRYGPQASARHW